MYYRAQFSFWVCVYVRVCDTIFKIAKEYGDIYNTFITWIYFYTYIDIRFQMRPL